MMQEAVDGRKLCNLQAQEANQCITTKLKLPEGIQCHLATSQFRKHVGFHIARGIERQFRQANLPLFSVELLNQARWQPYNMHI